MNNPTFLFFLAEATIIIEIIIISLDCHIKNVGGDKINSNLH
jgi:hypothetical protein